MGEDYQAVKAEDYESNSTLIRRVRKLHAKLAEQENTIRQLLRINSNLLQSLRGNWEAVAAPLLTIYGETTDAETESGPCQVSPGSTRSEDQDIQRTDGDDAA